MTMKKTIWAGAIAGMFLVLGLCARGELGAANAAATRVWVASPDGRNEISLWLKPLSYSVSRDGVEIVSRSKIGLEVDGRKLNKRDAKKAPVVTRKSEKGFEASPVYKKAKLDLTGEFAKADFGDWGVELAARNDGVAYRFYTSMPGEIVVDGEKANVKLPADATCWYNETPNFGNEGKIPQKGVFGTLRNANKQFFYLPFVATARGKTVAIMESDVHDYPILNFEMDDGELESEFSEFPARTYRAGGWDTKKPIDRPGRWVVVAEHEDYLVKTAGARTFPWRVFALADEPSKLADADIVTALARPAAKGADFSWVRPGKVAWDWWNDFDHKGVANGCTTAVYKRFIDFAAKTGVEYVIMDEGWSENLNIWKFNPKVDVPEVIRYGNEKGVGIILWMAWGQIDGEEEKVASHFAKLGAKGFKVDFMDRGDALVERFLWKFAEACAKNRMVVDYHGVHRPTGMSRAYPNVLNYEGIHGLEHMKWYKAGQYDMMANDVRACYLRMTAGPMDYTPGAMDNYVIGQYKGNNNNPGSEGTRCHQMAMMVVYEAPLQMLSDSPTKYERNMECFSFMSKVPTTWADTVGLGGTPDTFFAVAREAHDGAWYAAALGNASEHDVTIDTKFLGAGEWKAEVFRDAADSDTAPTHYVHETKTVKAGDKLAFPLAKGGGFAVKFSRMFVK